MRLGAAALLYGLLAKISLIFFSGHGAVSIFWPPAGLALAIVLLLGPRGALSVFVGACAANGTDASIPLLTALGLAAANTGGALAGAWLIRKALRNSTAIRELADYFRLIAGGFGSAAVCATFGVLVLTLSGLLTVDDMPSSILHWWMGDTLGIVMLTPLLLVWNEPPRTSPWSAKGAEAVMLLLLAFLVGQIVYFGWFGATAGTVVGHYWMFLIVVWVAVRLGIHGVVLVLLLGAVQGVFGIYQTEGMFASDVVKAPQINFWFFLLLLSTVGVSLSVHFARHEKLTLDLTRAMRRQMAMLDALPDLMFEVGLDGRFYKVHARDTQLLVAPAAKLLKSTVNECMPAPSRDVVMAALAAAHREGTATGYQFELALGPGRMWFELSVAAMHGSEGDDQPHFILLSRDITQRKRSQESLRIAAIAFDSEEGMVVLDHTRTVLRVNRAFCRLTGYASDEVLGRNGDFLRSPRHDEPFFEAMWCSVAQSGRWQGEMWMRRKNGEDMAAWGTLTAVQDESQQVTHYVRTISDVTLQKDQERIRMAREAQLREALVREVHHRIKNNLQGVNGVLRQFGAAHPEIAVPINQAIGQVQSIAAIHGLQGRRISGNLSLHQTISAVVTGVVSTWQTPVHAELDEASRSMSIGPHDGVPLALVFNELLSNAVKHGGPEGRVRLLLKCFDTQSERSLGAVLTITNRVADPMVPAVDGPFEATGLQLVSALLPQQGAVLEQARGDGWFVSTLTLQAPVIILEEGNQA